MSSSWHKSSTHVGLSKTWRVETEQRGFLDWCYVSQPRVLKGLSHLPLASEACSHAQISAQILVCDVQQKVSVHLELLRSKIVRNVRHIA